MDRKRVAILISGRGSNMESLINACDAADYPAKIVGVISNRSDAGGLSIANARDIPTKVITRKSAGSNQAADDAISEQLIAWKTDIICLAGFMRILTPEFATQWHGRLINIHPSLLPKYKGLDTHQKALDAGEKIHGCTVHHVIPALDEGPTILQASVDILPSDTAESLAARVLREEHRIYPEALAQICRELP